VADRRRLLRTAATVAAVVVIGPAVTVLTGLASIASFAAYMDVHGATVTMRIAAVGAVAVVVVPLGLVIGGALCERIERKAHRARLAALNSPRHAARSLRRTR
jgi:hypothetical protein